MIVIYILLLLLPFNLFAGFSISGVDHPRTISGTTCPESVSGVTSDYPEPVAHYRFENGALTTDSKSTNTLTNVNTVVADTSNYQEGAASADLEVGSSQYFTIADANLASGFPLKNGDTGKTITISAWIRLESVIGAGAYYMIWSKYSSTAASFWFGLNENERILASIGTGTGTTEEAFTPHATTLTADGSTWYHVTASFRDSDKAYALRVRNSSCAVVGADVESNTSANINVENATVAIGAVYWTSWSLYFDGLIDDLNVFADFLTADEATLVCKRLYK